MNDAEPDLFSFDAIKAIDALEVTSTQRTVTDYWIMIDGRKFDAKDVYNTLVETCSPSSDSYMTDHNMVDALKKLRVIEHGGSGRWAMSASRGPNYERFIAHLEKQIHEDHR